MATYKQIIPEFVNHGTADLVQGELTQFGFGEIFLVPFVIRHVDFDKDATLHFSQTKQISNYDMRGDTGFMYSIAIDYPNHPKMSHVIGTLRVSRDEAETNFKFLSTPHPLLMQKVYGYLHEAD